MVEMMVGTCNGHRDLDDEEVHRRWDMTPGHICPSCLPSCHYLPPAALLQYLTWPGEPLAGLQGVLQGAEALGPA